MNPLYQPYGMGSLPLIRNAQTRSLSAENPKGEKGKGGMAKEDGVSWESAKDLGQGWKCNPAIIVQPKQVFEMANIEGPGIVQHIWMTTHEMNWRKLILKVYWDDEEEPSINVPLGDFFCMGWNSKSNIASLPICVNPSGGLNCYFPMPFRKRCRIVIENVMDQNLGALYFQVTWSEEDVPENAAYLHAAWNRSNPLKRKEVHTIVDGIKGTGHFVGTYLAWQANSQGWWGEGEIKFYMDGDKEFPTICGTGTEDYFGGAWNFEQPPGIYNTYSTPYLGLHQHVGGDGQTKQGRRFGMYRFHILDPIHFKEDLRVTIQALGWREPIEGRHRYLSLQDDLASVAYWYQTEPHTPQKSLPDYEELEII